MLFEFNEITYTIGSEQKKELKLSGSVNSNEVLIVHGPSGSGKSSLLRILARLQVCESGEALLEGISWSNIPGPVWRAGVHYLFQKPAIFDGTFSDNLERPFKNRLIRSTMEFNPARAKELMERLLLRPGLWDQDAKTLSGGEVSRMAFIRSLMIDPRVLILDEPTAALDDRAKEAFYGVLSDWLSDGTGAAILVSHNNDYNALNKTSILSID